MRKFVLAVALITLMAVAAEAQVTFGYSKRDHNSSLTIRYSSGYGYGYGYGCGYGYTGSFGPGLVAQVNGGTLTFGVRHTFWGGYPGYGYGGFRGTGVYGGSSYGGYPGYYPPAIMDYSPAPPLARGVADRTHEYTSAKEMEEGRRRFRAGDYRGALDDFRAAVVADTENGLAQALFALALMVNGDGKNADKALREAVTHATFAKPDLADLFRDDKERSRVLAALAKVTGPGELTAAWAQSLAGDPARLKGLSGKDAAAQKLLK